MRHYPTNRYPGVNAHLNSYLLAKGKWSNFHTELIVRIREKLDSILPENYYAISEDGLQLNLVDEDTVVQSSSRPDIGILQTKAQQNPGNQAKTSPAISIPFKDLAELDIEEALTRVGIYEINRDDAEGKLVTTIEILSPANKPTGGNYQAYLEKRARQLEAGINLIELDLIHTKAPMLSRIPSYPRRKPDSAPYGIIVSIPQPSFQEGKSDWYPVAVDEPLTNLPVPLAYTETVNLDLQAVYNELFAGVRFYHHYVDYDTLPVNFSAYSEDDQQRIEAVLAAIRQE